MVLKWAKSFQLQGGAFSLANPGSATVLFTTVIKILVQVGYRKYRMADRDRERESARQT